MLLRMRLAIVALSVVLVASPAAAKQKPAWEGGFWGAREVEKEGAGIDPRWISPHRGRNERFITSQVRKEWRREHRLFASRADCEDWLYVMRSAFQDDERYSWCRKVNRK
jgi:hypothetical protein